MTVGDARFVELYERHYRHVYAYCHRRTSSERVEDAVADTFLTVWRKIDDVPFSRDALPWIYSVAYRVLNRQWRAASRQSKLRTRLDSMGVGQPVPPEETVIVGQDSERILKALAKLTGPDQEVLRLHVWEELGHREIAEVLGVSVSAVQKRFTRARDNLADGFNRLEASPLRPPAVQKGDSS